MYEVLNSEPYKRAERQKAIEKLDEVKKRNTKVVRAPQGQCEFSINLKPKKEKEMLNDGLLNIPQSAEYLNMTRHTLEKRVKNFDIPHIIVGKTKYFDTSDLDKHIIEHPIRKSHFRN